MQPTIQRMPTQIQGFAGNDRLRSMVQQALSQVSQEIDPNMFQEGVLFINQAIAQHDKKLNDINLIYRQKIKKMYGHDVIKNVQQGLESKGVYDLNEVEKHINAEKHQKIDNHTSLPHRNILKYAIKAVKKQLRKVGVVNLKEEVSFLAQLLTEHKSMKKESMIGDKIETKVNLSTSLGKRNRPEMVIKGKSDYFGLNAAPVVAAPQTQFGADIDILRQEKSRLQILAQDVTMHMDQVASKLNRIETRKKGTGFASRLRSKVDSVSQTFLETAAKLAMVVSAFYFLQALLTRAAGALLSTLGSMLSRVVSAVLSWIGSLGIFGAEVGGEVGEAVEALEGAAEGGAVDLAELAAEPAEAVEELKALEPAEPVEELKADPSDPPLKQIKEKGMDLGDAQEFLAKGSVLGVIKQRGAEITSSTNAYIASAARQVRVITSLASQEQVDEEYFSSQVQILEDFTYGPQYEEAIRDQYRNSQRDSDMQISDAEYAEALNINRLESTNRTAFIDEIVEEQGRAINNADTTPVWAQFLDETMIEVGAGEYHEVMSGELEQVENYLNAAEQQQMDFGGQIIDESVQQLGADQIQSQLAGQNGLIGGRGGFQAFGQAFNSTGFSLQPGLS